MGGGGVWGALTAALDGPAVCSDLRRLVRVLRGDPRLARATLEMDCPCPADCEWLRHSDASLLHVLMAVSARAQPPGGGRGSEAHRALLDLSVAAAEANPEAARLPFPSAVGPGASFGGALPLHAALNPHQWSDWKRGRDLRLALIAGNPEAAAAELCDGSLPLHRVLETVLTDPEWQAVALALVEAYPGAAKVAHGGVLPLTMSLRRGAGRALVLALVEAWPDAVRHTDSAWANNISSRSSSTDAPAAADGSSSPRPIAGSPSPSEYNPANNRDALQMLLRWGCEDVVADLLQRDGTLAYATSSNGYRPIHWALHHGASADFMRKILSLDATFLDFDGQLTSLMQACQGTTPKDAISAVIEASQKQHKDCGDRHAVVQHQAVQQMSEAVAGEQLQQRALLETMVETLAQLQHQQRRISEECHTVMQLAAQVLEQQRHAASAPSSAADGMSGQRRRGSGRWSVLSHLLSGLACLGMTYLISVLTKTEVHTITPTMA